MWQPPPLPRTLPAALRDLEDPSPQVRASAARDLAPHFESDRFQVAAALRRALSDAHHEPRAAAASAAGAAGAEEALDSLLTAVDDQHPLVCQMALEALGEFDDARAVARLREALSDARPEARFQALLGLPRRVDDAEADRILAAACRDDDASIRHIALRLAEERWPRPSTAAPRVQQAATGALRDPDGSVRVAAALVLATQANDAGAEVLLEVIEGRLRPREIEDEAAAVEAAGKLGLRQATPALERRAFGAVRLLREQCSFHARVSLARLGHERARAEIMKGLGAWSLGGRNEAVLAAGKARLEAARPRLEALRGAPERADPTLVEEALEALSDRA